MNSFSLICSDGQLPLLLSCVSMKYFMSAFLDCTVGHVYLGAFAIRVLDEVVQVERFIYLAFKYKCNNPRNAGLSGRLNGILR